MVNIMTIKSLKRFTKILNKTEGVSLMAIIILMVIMAVMGGVFSTIMGRWKLSAPSTINSNKAFYLAETAAMFALQDARYRFYGGSFNYGTRGTPYVVISSSTEEANYWFERPNDDDFYSSDDDSDSYDDDDISGPDDDIVDDDADDVSNPTLYTIIATGKVLRDGTTVAKRQIKIKVDITDNSADAIEPGVHTDGDIKGSGGNAGNGFGISDGTNTVVYNSPGDWNYADPPYTAADEADLIYRSAPTLDKDLFKALATDQGHYHNADLTVSNSNPDYPSSSYYYDSPIPNITYLEGSTSDLTVNANNTAWGIYYVEGDVTLSGNNSIVNGIIICEGDVTLNGNAAITGGIIHYGDDITGNGNPAAITLIDSFFDALNDTIPNITVVSWQEAVSAN